MNSILKYFFKDSNKIKLFEFKSNLKSEIKIKSVIIKSIIIKLYN